MLGKEPLKIAFVGTLASGKTTLLDQLRREFRQMDGIVFVEEVARKFFAENPNTLDRFSIETQGAIQQIVLEMERNAHNSSPKVIFCDRSVVDAVVYTFAYGDREGAMSLFEMVRFWLPTYHEFLLLDPTDMPHKTDNVRVENDDTRQKVHEAFLDFFNEIGIPHELLSGTLKDRVTRVRQILGEKYFSKF